MKRTLIALTAFLFMLSACKKIIIIPAPDVNSPRAKDSLALVAIYDACDGINWIEEYSKLDIWSDLTKPISDKEYWKGIETEVIDGHLRVTKIYLPGNGLDGELPEEIGNLSELTWLDLSFAKIRGKLPSEELAKLTKLKHLNLGNNTYIDPQPLNFIENMTQLEVLKITNSNFNAITPRLEKLQKLTELSISKNKIEMLPSSVGELKSLKDMYASSNNISSLPLRLGELSAALAKLVIDNNKFTRFPEVVFQLSELKYLDISDNQIENINAGDIRKKLPKLYIFKY